VLFPISAGGGRAEISNRVLKYLYNKKSTVDNKNSDISNLCHMIATTLEKNSNYIFGELGIDMAIDTNGGLWLIEVNSKPRKTTVTDYSKVIMKNTFKRPLEYAVFLAGF
jgi:glutathione synthase/RimK-type ligase-like ATP-grasp enzyme